MVRLSLGKRSAVELNFGERLPAHSESPEVGAKAPAKTNA